MSSILGTRQSIQNPSPLEGSGAFRVQQGQPTLRQLERREWWLWVSASLVAKLSAVAFVFTPFPFLFRHHEHFYQMSPDDARWAILCLLLLVDRSVVYNEWVFRRRERRPSAAND